MLLIICGTVVAVAILYYYMQNAKMKEYWSNRGFYSIDVVKLLGNPFLNMIRRVHVSDIDPNVYKIMKENNQPLMGYFEFSQPVLMVKDLELMRHIFVKDFDHFVDHRDFKANKMDDLTGKMLFFMQGEPWRELRVKMSPTFTTGKIRRMFDIINNCSDRFVTFLDEEIKTSQTINLVEGFGKYTVDVISSAAFGLESGAFREKKSMFEKMAEKLQFNLSFKTLVKFIVLIAAPKIAILLKLPIFDAEACSFFSSIIVSTIKHRETSGEKREDFLQLMLEARAGQLKTDEAELSAFEKEAAVTVSPKPKVTLTQDVICAQSILFFLGGFDTTQTLLQFAAYQLAVCPDIQEKLFDDVKESFENNGGAFTYESINEMEYMDKFMSETLRMYPPIPRLDRTCTKEYAIPGTELVIPVGTLVFLPSYAIHHDEDIYPDPERFDPERFSKEAKAARSPYAYMPFGHGPRNCIGMRFALTEVKLAIGRLVQNFILEPSEKTPIPIKFEPIASLKPAGGVWLNLKSRKNRT